MNGKLQKPAVLNVTQRNKLYKVFSDIYRSSGLECTPSLQSSPSTPDCSYCSCQSHISVNCWHGEDDDHRRSRDLGQCCSTLILIPSSEYLLYWRVHWCWCWLLWSGDTTDSCDSCYSTVSAVLRAHMLQYPGLGGSTGMAEALLMRSNYNEEAFYWGR